MLTYDEFKAHLASVNLSKEIFANRILEIVEICKKTYINYYRPSEVNYFNIEEILGYESFDQKTKESATLYVSMMNFEININIIDKFGNEIDLNKFIPIRWLFEDFEEELISGNILYKNDIEINRIKYISQKQILESLKSNFSKEECDALDIDNRITTLGYWIDNSSI